MLGPDKELELMRLAEQQQTRVDSFWGFPTEDKLRHERAEDLRKEILLAQQMREATPKAQWVIEQEEKNAESTQRKQMAFEEQKANYMKTFYSNPYQPADELLATKFDRTLFCGQGNSFAKNSANVRTLLVEALRSDYHKSGESVLNSAPNKIYRPYVSRATPPLYTSTNKPRERIQSLESSFRLHSHVDAIDGHPLYGWEQVLILKVIFDLMDIEGLGSLTLTQVLGIYKHEEAKALIAFTLYGSWFKLRQEMLFSFLFREQQMSESRLSFKTFVAGMKAVSKELSVNTNRIRLDEEHRAITQRAGLRAGDILGNTLERRAHLRRFLRVGDLVWGLFGNGVTWFPAVIEEVCTDGTYHLSYPLSAKRIKQVAHKTITFLRSTMVAPKNEGKIKPVPFDEGKICECVFDIIDEGKQGQLECQFLLEQLAAHRFSDIVKSSLAIATLVLDDRASLLVAPSERKSLHQIILQLYYDKAELNGGMITRVDFIEIGLIAVDLIAYNVR